MKARSTWARLGSAMAALLSLGAGEAWAVYSCSVTVTSAEAVYADGVNVDSNGTVTLTCTRTGDETVPLDYSIVAGYSPNAQQRTRRARLGATTNYLEYQLKKGTEGGGASCATGTDWEDSAKRAGKVMKGTLNFVGGALTASTTWGYCIRLPANNTMPAAGAYDDIVGVSAEFTGGSTTEALLNYTVWVTDRCLFGTYPSTMVFDYTSFSPSAVTATQTVVLRCSTGTPWTVSVDPAASSSLGLDYSIAASPPSGEGLGTTGQTITLTGTIPAGQAGTCALGTCTATRTHTLIISY